MRVATRASHHSACHLCHSCASCHLTYVSLAIRPEISHHLPSRLYPHFALPGTSPDNAMASAPTSPLPHSHMRTCNLCRQRRVKCDRGAPQCSNCLRSGSDCVYPPGHGRAPKKPRHGVAPQVSERLARLESIIKELSSGGSANSPSGHGTPKNQDPGPDTGTPTLDQEFSRLKVDDSKSYYVNNALWVTLADEVCPPLKPLGADRGSD
jgi:hypothetical protein